MVFPFANVHEGTRYRLKDLEKARIFQAICSAGTITRKEIAAAIGSRPTTVSNVVHQLMDDRLVIEGEVREPGKQGRPEMFLHPNYSRLVAVSICVVSREIKGALVGLDGAILAESSVELPSGAGNSDIVETISDIVFELRHQKPIDSSLMGVGISLTGSINSAEKRWMYTARWRNISNLDLGDLEARIGLPVISNRLVNSRLEFLLMTNPAFAVGGTLLFHWGYGIGAAYALDGRIIQATSGSFAELGHWNIVRETPQPCLCGGQGCLETVAALWALLPELSSRFGDVPEDEMEFAEFARLRGLHSDPL
ncbi:MAG TPA: ROK family transcriptional regulator, partial [Spirochaetia bacterium]|nr:ROK family transcriptional regulator [Spirochaetia bacterium]